MMPDNKDTNEILRLYSSDLLELQRHILDMVKDQSDQEEVRRYPEVQQLVTRIQDTVGQHFTELEQGLESLGGEKSSLLKQAMGRVAETALAVEIREMIPEIVVREFADQGYSVNSGVTEEVNQKAHQAWRTRSSF